VTTARVALATSAALPQLVEDDRLLQSALEDRGVAADPAVWTDPGVRWSSYDLTVIRSTWDYHRQLAGFLAWAERVSRESRLWNPLEIVRWNSHKGYLEELGRRGLPVLPSVTGRAGVSLVSVLRERGWPKAVVKPAVSADADGTYVVSLEEAAAFESQYQKAIATGQQLVQPYVEEIETGGEHSLLYYDGTYSHSVRRPPGLIARTPNSPPATVLEPSSSERGIAERAVAGITPVPLYARVDLVVRREGPPALMELELIEPSLYLAFHPDAPARLAEGILRRLGEPRGARPGPANSH
jgi:hypothetical protein